jgi:DNA polymerase eta
VMGFLKDVKFTKMRNLGGKFGSQVATVFDTDQVSEIWNYSLEQLSTKLGQEQGNWVYNVTRGIDHSEVNSRTKIKSMLR